MALSKNILIEYECKKCDHKWFPRRNMVPNICPKCKSRLWNKSKVKKK